MQYFTVKYNYRSSHVRNIGTINAEMKDHSKISLIRLEKNCTGLFLNPLSEIRDMFRDTCYVTINIQFQIVS